MKPYRKFNELEKRKEIGHLYDTINYYFKNLVNLDDAAIYSEFYHKLSENFFENNFDTIFSEDKEDKDDKIIEFVSKTIARCLSDYLNNTHS